MRLFLQIWLVAGVALMILGIVLKNANIIVLGSLILGFIALVIFIKKDMKKEGLEKNGNKS